MRPSYLKNAALLTGADVVLRLAGMGLRIWLANALGGEGMGLYQLVLAVYSLFVTLATSGVSVAATRLMAEELSRSRAEARGMLLRLLGAALLLGSAAWAGQFGLAELAAAWWLGDVRAAVAQYGNLKGMALPLLTFPFGLLGSLSVLLMPEITQAHIRGETGRLSALLDRMLRLTGYFSALAGAVFWVWGAAAARLFYGPDGAEAGFYLTVLGPAMPLMYLESMVDGAMKGVGEQKAVFRYSLWDAVLRIAGVMVLLPRFGMKGFLFVILLSSVYTCLANTARLLRVSGMRPALMRWLGAPLLAAGVSAGAGVFLREMLSGWQARGMPEQLAALCIGCCGMGLAGLAAAWPLGLGAEVRAALHPDRARQKAKKA